MALNHTFPSALTDEALCDSFIRKTNDLRMLQPAWKQSTKTPRMTMEDTLTSLSQSHQGKRMNRSISTPWSLYSSSPLPKLVRPRRNSLKDLTSFLNEAPLPLPQQQQQQKQQSGEPVAETVMELDPKIIRRGKWTLEEEMYAAEIIKSFIDGLLPIQYGTTLRGYLAQQLNCDPMRISKKLVPGSIFGGVRITPKIGRKPYFPQSAHFPGAAQRQEHALNLLQELRCQFLKSVQNEGSFDYRERVTSPARLSKRKRERVEHVATVRSIRSPEASFVQSTSLDLPSLALFHASPLHPEAKRTKCMPPACPRLPPLRVVLKTN